MQGFNGPLSSLNKSAYYSANFIDTISDVIQCERFEPQDGSGIEYYTAEDNDSDQDAIDKEVTQKRGFDGIKHWAVRVEVLVPMGEMTRTIVALIEFYDRGKTLSISDFGVESDVVRNCKNDLNHVLWADIEATYLGEMGDD